MTVATSINVKTLLVAREQVNMSVEAATKRLGFANVDILEEIEAGKKELEFRKLKDMARIYAVPIGYFYLEEMPIRDLGIVDFRINPDFYNRPLRPRLIKALRNSIICRETILELYSELDDELPVFNFSCSINDDPETIGREIRKTFPENLMSNKAELIKRVMRLFESYGVYVNQIGGGGHSKVDYEEFDGAAFYFDLLPMIVLNSNVESKNKVLFTLFHELAHLMLKNTVITDFFSDFDSSLAQNVATVEAFCNKVSAAILVPGTELLTAFSDHNISELAGNFRVSREVVVIRLRNLGALTQSQCNELLSQYRKEFRDSEIRKKRLRSSPPKIDPNIILKRNLGGLYVNAVKEAFVREKVSYFDTLSYLGMKEKAARKIIYG